MISDDRAGCVSSVGIGLGRKSPTDRTVRDTHPERSGLVMIALEITIALDIYPARVLAWDVCPRLSEPLGIHIPSDPDTFDTIPILAP